MHETETPPAAEIKVKPRPFLLSIVCMALFVYTATLSLIFLFSILFNNWISKTLAVYFPEREIENGNILVLSAIAFVLASTSFVGTYLIWRLKRAGLYLFSITSLLLLALPFLFGFGNPYSLLIMGVIILLLFLYYRRFK